MAGMAIISHRQASSLATAGDKHNKSSCLLQNITDVTGERIDQKAFMVINVIIEDERVHSKFYIVYMLTLDHSHTEVSILL